MGVFCSTEKERNVIFMYKNKEDVQELLRWITGTSILICDGWQLEFFYYKDIQYRFWITEKYETNTTKFHPNICNIYVGNRGDHFFYGKGFPIINLDVSNKKSESEIIMDGWDSAEGLTGLVQFRDSNIVTIVKTDYENFNYENTIKDSRDISVKLLISNEFSKEQFINNIDWLSA